MSERVVYLNGVWLPESAARLSIYDTGVLTGEMAFEVTRTCQHRPFRLGAHIERLYASLAVLEIDPGLRPGELIQRTEETLTKNLSTEAADVDWNIIHNVSRGPGSAFLEAFTADEQRPTVVISCFPLARKMARLAEAYDLGLELVVPPQRSLPAELWDAHVKSRARLHYQRANLQAAAIRPGSTPLLIDPDGYLTETTTGNVFLVSQGILRTPEPRNLLPGVTRAVVQELASWMGVPVEEGDLTVAEAKRADEVFVTSTSIGILHARSIDGQVVGSGRAGPLTEDLRSALFTEVGLDFAAQARAYAARY